ncbi:protein CNGC15b isoform X1 [Hevea brasiliensis]|uniref:protein CNGC15b isoform X1 n=1 Tax=Hevea brasiliensis TaxID=3981 RepID=UPI0025EA518A|nr:protein CNGC15b isoform X1 [Hevea brasiliensis]
MADQLIQGTALIIEYCIWLLVYRALFQDVEVEKIKLPRKVIATETSNEVEKVSVGKSFPRKVLSRVFSEDYEYDAVEKTILDPRGPVIDKWNKIFFAACLTSLFVDPLFFLLPQVENNCIHVSTNLEVAFTVIRSLADVVYIFHIFVRFRMAYVAPSSRVIGRGELVVDPAKIASRYLDRDFWFDMLAAQPIPQVLTWAVMPSLRGSSMVHTRIVIRTCIIIQYLLRLYLIFPLSSQINKATGVVLETAWAGAAYNLVLYMLASHVLGCLWYLLAIERQEHCWRKVCSLEQGECNYSFIDCSFVDDPGRVSWLISSNVSNLCDPSSGFFEFGIYGDALASQVTSSSFFKKFFYCLWWAFRNLNSLGQGLSTSTYIGEINYAMIVGIVSLMLFGLLIGNMQRYLQSSSARLEQWRTFKTDAERWMRHRQLPHEMKESVRRYNQHRWCATGGVDEEAILKSLPMDLRRIIKRHLCLDLVRKVQLFNMMDEQMLDAICERLKPCLYDQGTCLVRESDPVNEMIFIIRGRLNSYTTNGGRADFFNSCVIAPGDFCGEELLTWALDPRSNSNITLPLSTRTVIAITDVEAFALIAEDLKFVAYQFRRLNSKQLRHVFRFHSLQWRTWAACFIQAAWFRYKRRKEEAELNRIKTSMSGGKKERTCSSSLLQVATNFTIYASKLAASTRRGGPKPEEPDFTDEK